MYTPSGLSQSAITANDLSSSFCISIASAAVDLAVSRTADADIARWLFYSSAQLVNLDSPLSLSMPSVQLVIRDSPTRE